MVVKIETDFIEKTVKFFVEPDVSGNVDIELFDFVDGNHDAIIDIMPCDGSPECGDYPVRRFYISEFVHCNAVYDY